MTDTASAPSAIDHDRSPEVPTTTSTGVDHDVLPADGILLASFGGPEGQDDVLPFLRNVTRGRGIPDERLEEVAVHYRTLGGVSPINAQNRALKAALEAELARRGLDLPVYWGNRNWAPFTKDAVQQAYGDGKRNLIGIATSAYSSYSSCRQYREDFGIALVETGLLGRLEIGKLRHYFSTEGFLAPVADGVRDAVRRFREAGHAEEKIEIVFSTHSVPDTMADASGPADTRREHAGGWYVAQHLSACRWVIDRVAEQLGGTMPSWRLVYQSRSGSPRTPWLEPDVNDVLEDLAAAGTTAVVGTPIGFVSDHVEVVWDLDTEAKETAEECGVAFERTPTAGTDPRFVAALVDLVEERLGGPAVPAVTDFPRTPDVCGVACCAGARSRPTVAGVDSEQDRAAAAEGTTAESTAAEGIAVGVPASTSGEAGR